jgi:superfamily II DNA/RNA helicase
MSTTFSKLGVPHWVSEALARQGITEPFQIQKITIKEGLDGEDICGRAPTGSGKTLAFGIPLVVKTKVAKPRKPQSLILAPTRELADQICKELRAFSGKRIVSVVYGGVSYGPQRKALAKGVDILVACPGRLEDLIEQGELTLEDVKQVVIDEADRMADMGFMPAVKRILDQTSNDRQTILFSATLDHDVAKLKKHYQRNPVTREIGEKTPDIKNADHTYAIAKKADKPQLVAKAVNSIWPAIIFCRTRHGKVQALVATDVAARGIHVDGVALVVHYDPPEDHKAYIHRSGRTARAGSQGVVLSIIQPEQQKNAKKLQKRLGINESIRKINPEELPDIQPQLKEERQEKTRHEHKRANDSRTPSKSKGKKPANRNGKGSAKKRPQNKKHKSRKTNVPQQKRKSSNSNRQKSQQNKAKKSNNGNRKGQPNRKARRAHLQPKKR